MKSNGSCVVCMIATLDLCYVRRLCCASLLFDNIGSHAVDSWERRTQLHLLYSHSQVRSNHASGMSHLAVQSTPYAVPQIFPPTSRTTRSLRSQTLQANAIMEACRITGLLCCCRGPHTSADYSGSGDTGTCAARLTSNSTQRFCPCTRGMDGRGTSLR